MNNQREYFEGAIDYGNRSTEHPLNTLYARCVSGLSRMPVSLVSDAWEIYEEEFWDKRLSMEQPNETSNSIWRFIPFL